jgi:hypothetical protein
VLATGPAVLWMLGATSVPDLPPLGPPARVAPAVLHDPAPAAPTPAAPAPPVRIRALDAGLDAPVVDSGVDARGGMAVPHDVRTVGWYRFGARPGAAVGSAVLAGHVDDRVQGFGAFHRIADLAPGSSVRVTLADGTTVGYRVTAVERIVKSALPVDRLFARDGASRLVLVTCGGAFDRAAGGYRDNVVVTAVPEAGP